MLQIADTFEYLRKAGQFLPATLLDFRIQCSDEARTTRGTYLRETYETNDVKEFTVAVQPRFKNYSELDHHIDFEKHFTLKATEPWIKVPEVFVCTSVSRCFILHVDPRKTPLGQAVYGEVQAFDHRASHLGPLFRVPVTVIRAEAVDQLTYSKEFNFDAHSGIPVRRFVSTPEGATVAEVKVMNLSKIPADRFLLHKVDLVQDKCYRNTENYKNLGPDHDEWTNFMPVKGGRTVEFCLARGWNRGHEKSAKVRMEIKFHGVQRPEELHLVHEAGSTVYLANVAPFRPVEINPTVQLKTLVVPLKQTCTAKFEPLGSQDVFHPGVQINRLLLSYKLSLTKSVEVAFELPGLSQYLYESPVDCILFQVFNCSKGYEGAASSFPDRYVMKLEKGDHIIHAQLRHEDENYLEIFRDIPLHVLIKVPNPITLDVYTNLSSATRRSGLKWTKKVLVGGQQFPMYSARHNFSLTPFQKKTMEERKSALIDLLLVKATLVADSHLLISTLEIPEIFRSDLIGVTEMKATKEILDEDLHKIVEKNSSKPATPRADFDAAYGDVLRHF